MKTSTVTSRNSETIVIKSRDLSSRDLHKELLQTRKTVTEIRVRNSFTDLQDRGDLRKAMDMQYITGHLKGGNKIQTLLITNTKEDR